MPIVVSTFSVRIRPPAPVEAPCDRTAEPLRPHDHCPPGLGETFDVMPGTARGGPGSANATPESIAAMIESIRETAARRIERIEFNREAESPTQRTRRLAET